MEAHPVPKNVTAFEFHLIGNMTIKQFGYFFAGSAIAFITFSVLFSANPYIATPIMLVSFLTGAALAFVPIADRPLDAWILAYFKAIFQPTTFTFQSKYISSENPTFHNRLPAYLSNVSQAPQPTATPIPQMPAANQNQTQAPTPPLHPPPLPITPQKSEPPKNPEPLPTSDELKKTVDLAKNAQVIQTKIIETEKQLNQIKAEAAIPGNDPHMYAPRFQKVLNELQLLNQEASQISKDMAMISKNNEPKVVPKPAVKASSVPTMTLTSIPNIINGIVTDSQGSYIDGAIIVAHDKQGLPVRALKSNKLGQFIAATPLPSGTYVLVTEKDSLVFDKIEVELTDIIPKPVIISAKKPELAPEGVS